jgi:glycosyltransferase involved in cell wall biosynthesis
MKILWHIHAYPPVHNAGAEWMAHDMNRYLKSKGHEIRIISSWGGEFEGIKVHTMENPVVMRDHYLWSDIVITHLGMSGLAYNISKLRKRPMVFVSHNTHPYTFGRQANSGVFIIHNAQWSMDALKYKRPGIVVYPPVDYRRFKPCKKGDRITLINLNVNKGGAVLESIARMMPDHKFLAVKGMYGDQHLRYPSNVEVIENTPDIQSVYDRSRIVIMPSEYESWGRVGVEAMACGLPVIAHPTPGLYENLAHAGIFCDRNDPRLWVEAIKNLDDRKSYIEQSKKSLARAVELDPTPQLERMEAWLESIVNRKTRI